MFETVDAKLGYEIARDILFVVIFVWAFLSKRHAATKASVEETANAIRKEVKEANTRANVHGERILKIEQTIQHMPNTSEIKELTDRLSGFHGDNKAMMATIQSLASQVRAIDDYLRNKKS